MASPDLIYIGIFLDPMDTKRLLRTFGQAHPEVQAHHMTLWHYNEGIPPNLDLPWGKTITLKVIGHTENDQVQVAVIEPPAAFRPPGRTPHVTISVAPGVSAKLSNDLLESWEPDTNLPGLPTVRGKIGWMDSKKKVHFDAPPASP